jgi:hypothetical protein
LKDIGFSEEVNATAAAALPSASSFLFAQRVFLLSLLQLQPHVCVNALVTTSLNQTPDDSHQAQNAKTTF